MEIWKDIPGYDGHYQASSEGRIRTTAHTRTRMWRGEERTYNVKEKIRTQSTFQTNGRKYVGMPNGNRPISQLVCEAFHGPRPTPQHEADHIDENKTNNKADNLQWLTKRDNLQKSLNKTITLQNISSGEKHTFSSQNDASEVLGIPIPCVSHLRNGRIKTSCGYRVI